MMTSDARKRLEAIEQFSDLGSGFQIAMKDLEIRGAGDLLGAEQSGFINEMGFETYQKMMQEALEELKDEPNRRAYFITVLCFKDKDGEHYFEGRVYGNITTEVFGEDGFGYDPIFIPDDHNLTFAQMLPEEKNKISHRSEALKKFLEFLNSKGGIL